MTVYVVRTLDNGAEGDPHLAGAFTDLAAAEALAEDLTQYCDVQLLHIDGTERGVDELFRKKEKQP